MDIADHAELPDATGTWLLCIVEVTFEDETTQRYFVPLGIAWESMTDDPLVRLLSHTPVSGAMGTRGSASFTTPWPTAKWPST